MKKLLLFLVFTAFLYKGNAQEMTPALGYKNFGLSWFPLPFYTIDKRIVPDRSAKNLLKTNPAAHRAFKQGKTREEMSLLLLLGTMPLGYLADKQKSNAPAAWSLLGVGVASLCGSVALDFKAAKKHREAVDIYNDKIIGSLEPKSEINFHFGVSKSGNIGFFCSL